MQQDQQRLSVGSSAKPQLNNLSILTKKTSASGSAQCSPAKYSSRGMDKQKFLTQQAELPLASKHIKEYEVKIKSARVLQSNEALVKSMQQEVQGLSKRLAESERAREEMMQRMRQMAECGRDGEEKDDMYKQVMIQENEELRQQMANRDHELRDKECRIDQLQQMINEYELEKQEMKIIVEETLAKYSSQESTVYESETKRIALQHQYEQCLDEYNGRLTEHYEIIEGLTRENADLKSKISELEQSLTQMAVQRTEMETRLKKEQDKTKKVAELEKLVQDLKQQRDLLMKHLEQQQKEREQLYAKYQELKDETDTMIIKMREEFLTYQDRVAELSQQLLEKDQEIIRKDQIIKQLTQKQIEMQEQQQRYQAFMEAQEDLKRRLQELEDENESLRGSKQQLERELMEARDWIEEYGGKDLVEKMRELTKKNEEQQKLLESLRGTLASMKESQQIYVPEREDPLDNQLADYINNYSDRSKLRILFMKESDGVYQFGSRRVYVRVERDKITVRVGGGYLSIDEFLDIYTPMELERLERNDPLKKFSEKVAVQKTLTFTSPIRSPKVHRDTSQTRSANNLLSIPALTNLKNGSAGRDRKQM